MLPNVNIQKQSGLGRSAPNADNVTGMICGGVAIAPATGITGIALLQIVQLNSILDAQGYGITRAYDTANSILVYEHIYKFFKRCPGGTLYLMLVPQRITPVTGAGATFAMAVTTPPSGSSTTNITINGTALSAAPIALSSGTLAATATAIVAAINGYTGTSGYSAVTTSGGGYTITAPVALGAGGNGVVPVIVNTGTVVNTGAAGSGGVTAVTGGAVTLSQMMDITGQYGPVFLSSVLAIRAAAGLTGGIRQLGAVLNPDATALAAESASTGISNDTLTAVAKAQALANYAFAAFYPVDIMLEGRWFNATPTNAINMRGQASGQVSVVIGSDPAVSSISISSATPYQYYAALGDALGCMAQCAVDESIGATALFNLTDTSDGTFLAANLSSNQSIQNYSAGTVIGGAVYTGLDQLYDKGYIVPRIVVSLPGIYWGGGPTCQLISADDAFIEDSRTLNKAAIYIRAAFLPTINAKIPLAPSGAISPTVVALLQDAAEKNLDTYMTNKGEISGRQVLITTTDQNGNPINFIQSGEVIPYVANVEINGIAREISGTVALVSSLPAVQ